MTTKQDESPVKKPIMIQDADTMKSPITGGKVTLHREWREMEFRKEKYRVMFPYYRCEDTGEQFTTTESDGVWYTQLRNQYCCKHGIPYLDEIVDIRKRYGMSAAKMSTILGFGPNQWRKYEQEEVPNVSNGRMIRSIMDPSVFMELVRSAKEDLTEREYEKITSRITAIRDSDRQQLNNYEIKRIYATSRGIDNGFGPLSLERLKNAMLYLLEHCHDVRYTKMGVLLCFVDFLSYRERGTAMTGLRYLATECGPMPERWEHVYSAFEEIRHEIRPTDDHDAILLATDSKADVSLFSNDELQIMQRVIDRFGNLSPKELTAICQQETGWTGSGAAIPYPGAFEMII